MAPPHRPPPRDLDVQGKQYVTPNMLRITLGGPGLSGFPHQSDGGYVKLRLFPGGAGSAAVVRTYTIRAQREGSIDVDFAMHDDSAGHAGPATQWARDVSIGAQIAVGGPGAAKPLPPRRAFYAVAGDMTALPAITVNLAHLPVDARGYVALEVQSREDIQPLDCPPGITVDWLVNPDPGTQPDLLADAMRAAIVDEPDLYGWVACEFGGMQKLRDLLRGERSLGSDALYISSYWKLGLIEDEHKRVKREDAEAVQ